MFCRQLLRARRAMARKMPAAAARSVREVVEVGARAGGSALRQAVRRPQQREAYVRL